MTASSASLGMEPMYRKLIDEIMSRGPEGRMVVLDAAARWIKGRAETESLTTKDAVAMRGYLARLFEYMIDPSEAYSRQQVLELMDHLAELSRTAVDFVDEEPDP